MSPHRKRSGKKVFPEFVPFDTGDKRLGLEQQK
jgi:hypothetical protein